MKVEFITAFKKIAVRDKKAFFLTGDLGFHAFEQIRDQLGERFINAGVAEQNMVSVAAGLCAAGLRPWVYSISTFLTLKTVEQVRNDICHTHLPVKLAGFGGGYGYGIMGESHHLLEDIAIYSTFPNMKMYIPAFSEDVENMVREMHGNMSPSYLRLNLVPKTNITLSPYSPVRQIMRGKKLSIAVLGPLIHHVLNALQLLHLQDVDVFSVSQMPFGLQKNMFASFHKTRKLLIVEEHSHIGGLGEKILATFASKGKGLDSIIHLAARGYPSGLYGNHAFHQKENSLDAESIARNIKKLT